MLLSRVLTAAVFTPLLLLSIWRGGAILQWTCLALCLLMLWEYGCLVLPTGLRGLALGIGGLHGGWACQLLPAPPPGLALAALCLLALLAVLMAPQPLVSCMQRAGLLLLGVVYCTGLLPHLLALRQVPVDGLGLALLALLSTWGGDTGAYFVGRAYGSHRLYPAVSPGKTWEGALGGLFTAMAVAWGIRRALALQLPASQALLLGAVAAVMGLLGDLSESLLKRSVGAKDSSWLIPGHGGVLDRFDGVLFAVPAVHAIGLACQLV